MVNMITALCGYFSGTFVSDTGGTFKSDTPGTFVSDIGGTFEVILSYYWQKKCKDLQRKSEQPSGFVPIVFNSSPAQLNNSLYGNKSISGSQLPTDNLIEIVYPNGVIVRMPLGTGIKQLESLILLSR